MSKEHIIVIKEDSTCRIVPYAQAATEAQLHQLQRLVGGYIQIVPYKYQDFIMIVDEEGAFKDTKLNRLAYKATGNTLIFGTAVIAKTGEEDICGMSMNEAVEWLSDLAKTTNHKIYIEIGG